MEGRGDAGRQSGTAELTDIQAAAAAINGFTGPNVSVAEASDIMRSVHGALESTEMFLFQRGMTARLQFGQGVVSGSIAGTGRSVLNTSSDVQFTCEFRAKRVE